MRIPGRPAPVLSNEPAGPLLGAVCAVPGRPAPVQSNLPPRFVPGTFLVADVAGQIVGRSSIRFELNEFLLREGGHIGYGVLPGHRRRGYATEILRQSLIIARAEGVGRVLVTCDDDNAGSRAVIESCGGQLDSVVTVADGRPPIRRYWID
jgi:predicted acetyltransferase